MYWSVKFRKQSGFLCLPCSGRTLKQRQQPFQQTMLKAMGSAANASGGYFQLQWLLPCTFTDNPSSRHCCTRDELQTGMYSRTTTQRHTGHTQNSGQAENRRFTTRCSSPLHTAQSDIILSCTTLTRHLWRWWPYTGAGGQVHAVSGSMLHSQLSAQSHVCTKTKAAAAAHGQTSDPERPAWVGSPRRVLLRPLKPLPPSSPHSHQ